LGDEQGRRLMFPQVLGIVRRYVETRLEFMGAAAPEEIALGKYRSTIESRVVAAIRPADGEGEGSGALLPVLHDMAGVGSTGIAPFLTSRPASFFETRAVCGVTTRRLDHRSTVVVWSGGRASE